MKKSIILIIIFSLSPYTSTAQVDKDRIKASALFYICNYVDWPNNSEFKNFSIGILGENEILENELSLIAKNKLIKKKIIKINTLENITSINNFQVLYVDEKYNGSIKELFSIAQSKNILLVTNELNEPLYSMINFVFNKKTNKIGFEVNKQNLILTNFDYSDELLLYGGSVLDIKELYKTTQELLNKNTQKVAALEIENKKKESEIIEKNASIQNLQNMIFESSRTLEKLNDSTVIQQQKIAQQ
ncbi:MAG: YfiR family protein, partial [Bacteroidales bacterium]|nr:YfiR family protein [Bacteroidales bacterium]